jgi:hypothetical protein
LRTAVWTGDPRDTRPEAVIGRSPNEIRQRPPREAMNRADILALLALAFLALIVSGWF